MPISPILLAATFTLCSGSPRITCVVDGDTFWLEGEKILISDINTPETHRPGCAFEKALGKKATQRMMTLLNRGDIELTAASRNRDRYGRLLRVVSRDGQSLGQILVDEGLAEQWKGRRSNWCLNQKTG